MEAKPRIRFPLMGLGVLGLLAAMWAGLVRLGWGLPALRPGLPIAHGPLMISGFLGTLISLERAVALERRCGPTRRRCSRGWVPCSWWWAWPGRRVPCS